MEVGQKVLQNLLDGKTQYRIPLFQRTYEWSQDQWKRLWEDLMRVYDTERPRSHFVGSMVTYPIHVVAGDATKYAVIDGQQRMTTLLILLSVIRDQAQQQPETWGQLSDEIWKTCLINEFAQQPEEHFKLMPSRRDRIPFNAVVNGNTPTDETQQVTKASRYFNDMLSQGDKRGVPFDLRKLKNCVTNSLDIVSITLTFDDNPNRIFESLNYTGISLGASDLIRNYLFMNIREVERQDNTYNEYWYPMQEMLGNWMNDFFWRYLMMDGSLPRNNKDDIFNGVRQLIGHEPSDELTAKATQNFHEFAHYYAQLVELDSSGLDDSTVEQIHRLNQWEIDVARPFLMKALHHVNSSAIPEQGLLEVMRMIESFVVRRAVCGVPTNSLRSYFAQMSAGVDFEDFVESSQKHLSGRGWDWPSDDRFRDGFIQFRLYNPSRLRRTRLILDSLERSFGMMEMPALTDQITIEHIMPQSLSDDWIAALGPNSVDIHSQWLHTVGNLTLTGYNSELGNMPFVEKKVKLANANFALSSSIQEYDKWSENSIRERGCELAERALQIWPRP